MTSSLFLLLLLGASLTVHGRFVDTYETAEDEVADELEFIELFKPEEQALLDDIDYEQEGDEDEEEDFEAPLEETDVDNGVELVDDIAENSLGCPRRGCSFCLFNKFRIRLCIVAKFTGSVFVLSFQANGRTFFSYTVNTSTSRSFKISKKRFPTFARRFIKSDLKIQLNKIDIGKKSFCIRLSIKLKRPFGNVSGKKCFNF